MPLVWNNTLATGIRQIDLQHQELLEMINELEAAYASGATQQACDEIYPRLAAYVLFHFATEESMLPAAASTHARMHRAQHQAFAEQIATRRIRPAESLDMAELIAYLRQWLIEHIMKTDRDLAQHIRTANRAE
jgi:hemerythrin